MKRWHENPLLRTQQHSQAYNLKGRRRREIISLMRSNGNVNVGILLDTIRASM
jgi:hypothetical protein